MIRTDRDIIDRLRAQGTPEALEAADALETLAKYEHTDWFQRACIDIDNLQECRRELDPMLEAKDAKTRGLAGRLLAMIESRIAAAA
jgi:hypothetical protein